jgi:hypothetical protein
MNSGVAGWSESYYCEQPNPQIMSITANSLAKFRMRLCGEGINMPYVRISDLAVRGDAVLDSFPPMSTGVSGKIPEGYSLIKPAVNSPADVAWTSVIVQLSAANIAVGRIFMRGVNDEFFTNDKIFNPDPGWIVSFKAFQKELFNAANGWGVIRAPASTPANTFRIGGAAAVLATNLSMTCAPGFTVAPGLPVKIRGLKSNQGIFSGTFFAQTFAAGTLTINKQFDNPQPVFTPNTGTVMVAVPSFVQGLLAFYRSATSRHTGRPFGAPVGRRKKVVRLL